MTDKNPRRSSGGGMYDPARDTWDDRSGDRDHSGQLHRSSDQSPPQPDKTGVDSPAQASTQLVGTVSVTCEVLIVSCLPDHFRVMS